jgi:predicted CXXCH cytochrome family protein
MKGEPVGKPSLSIPGGGVTLEMVSVVDSSFVPKGYVCRSPFEEISPAVLAASAKGHLPVLVSYQSLADVRSLITALPQLRLVLTHSAEVDEAAVVQLGQTWIVSVPRSGREVRALTLSVSGGEISSIVTATHGLPASLALDSEVTARLRAFYAKHRLGGFVGPALLSPQAVATAQFLAKAAAKECGSCHKAEEQQWAATKHARAWLTLRENDAHNRSECVGCHTTPLAVASLGSSISGVGCNTCHGDGFRHAADPRRKGLISRGTSEKLCMGCHTRDASPHFEYSRFHKLVTH